MLGDLGYAVETDWRPIRVELVRPGSGWVDVHPVVFDADGNGVQAGPDDTEFRYPAEIFTTGRLGGIVVGCVSAAAQRTAHEGYAPRPQDEHDLAVAGRAGSGWIGLRRGRSPRARRRARSAAPRGRGRAERSRPPAG